jgi:hypothetical protein
VVAGLALAFEQQHAMRGGQFAGDRGAGDAGTDHDHVGVLNLAHRAASIRGAPQRAAAGRDTGRHFAIGCR